MNTDEQSHQYMYRGKPIKEYVLATSKILIGNAPLIKLPKFIKSAVARTKEFNRNYLFRDEFGPLIQNFNDYLGVSYQLGLLEKSRSEDQDQKRKRYFPSRYAEQISNTDEIERIKIIIGDGILDIVGARKETDPDERHAIILLWLFLTIKSSGREPQKYNFTKESDKPGNYYPSIRLNFSRGLCHFLFGGDTHKERQFLETWNQRM